MSDLHRLDDAATAALWPIRDARVERLGLIYGDDYARTPTSSQRERSRATGAFKIPAGSLRATFHNHPEAPVSTFTGSNRLKGDTLRAEFSTNDRLNADRLKVPAYISAGDRVLRYDPRTGTIEDVLAQFPIEEFLRYLAEKRSQTNPIAAAIIAEQNRKQRAHGGSRR